MASLFSLAATRSVHRSHCPGLCRGPETSSHGGVSSRSSGSGSIVLRARSLLSCHRLCESFIVKGPYAHTGSNDAPMISALPGHCRPAHVRQPVHLPHEVLSPKESPMLRGSGLRLQVETGPFSLGPELGGHAVLLGSRSRAEVQSLAEHEAPWRVDLQEGPSRCPRRRDPLRSKLFSPLRVSNGRRAFVLRLDPTTGIYLDCQHLEHETFGGPPRFDAFFGGPQGPKRSTRHLEQALGGYTRKLWGLRRWLVPHDLVRAQGGHQHARVAIILRGSLLVRQRSQFHPTLGRPPRSLAGGARDGDPCNAVLAREKRQSVRRPPASST
jgi:hypothetical protein